MFIVTHAAIGALNGEELPGHPILVFTLAFLAHFLTDLIPHGDTNLYKGFMNGTKVKKALVFVGLDTVVAIFFAMYLFTRVIIDHRLSVVMGVIGGVLPDAPVAIYELFHFKWLRWFHKVHFYFHNLVNSRTGDLSLQTGMSMEVPVLAFFIYHVIW